MSTFARTDTSVIGRWWWTVDRWTIAALFGLIAMGAILALAASPPVAERIGLDTYHFAKRQVVFLSFGLAVVFAVSLMSPKGIRRLAAISTAGAIILMIMALGFGVEIKGATRWVHIVGFSLQPSEFVKPSFAVLAAWMLSEQRLNDYFPGYAIVIVLFTIIIGLLLLQPDVGMSIVVSAVLGVQLFLAGLPLAWVSIIAVVFLVGGVGAYFTFSHVQIRVDRFFDPTSGEGYQVSKALEAFRNGGFIGRGPGEGEVKEYLPDAHADFIMAVAGEEFGLVVCLGVVVLFAFILLRGFARVLKDNDLFVVLAVGGLLTQFGLQAFINLASTLNLIPPKGMTLPFISYGGSSTLALAIGMGMVLALTRDKNAEGGHL